MLTVVPKVPVKEVPADGDEATASRIVAAPSIVQTDAPRKPKPSGTAAAVALVMPVLKALPRASVSTVEASKPSGGDRLAAVVAFLRGALEHGPLDVKEIERRAVEAGLLEENMPINKSKVFRSARAMLGVKSHQKPGRRAAGWVWSLPDQETSEAQPAAPNQAISDPEPAAQLSNNPVRESRETRIAPKSTEHRQPAPAEAPKAVNGHPANLPDSEPFGLNDPGETSRMTLFSELKPLAKAPSHTPIATRSESGKRMASTSTSCAAS